MTSSQSLETRRLLLCLYWATFIGNDEVTPVCLTVSLHDCLNCLSLFAPPSVSVQ